MEYSGEQNLEVMKLAKNYNNHLINLISSNIPDNASNILDFGSGDGYFAKNIQRQIKKDVICLEPADNLQKYYNTKPLSNLNEIEDNSIDFIYSLNVLEHIEDDKAIINEFYRILKSDGCVFLYLPAFDCLYSSMDKLVGHYRRYSKSDLARLFDKNKWEGYSQYVDFTGYFITLLFKFIGNKNGTISPLSIKIFDKVIFPISLFLDKITFGKILGKNIVIKMIKK